MATISTHNGSTAHQAHNIRAEKVVSKEEHIDPNGIHETWIHEPVREAYHRLFDESVTRYNAKQTRIDRKIDDYYNKVKKDKKQNLAYEMIIGIYGQDCSAETGKAIMQKFVQGWQERNPNLVLIGAYYHADEQGEPHVHIDYVPVAHGYTKGMDTQAGLVKALEEQGFTKQGKITAQIQWEHRENTILEKLCNERGIHVEHPKEEKKVHQETEIYKAEQKLKTLKNEIEELSQIKEINEKEVISLDKKVSEKQTHIDDLQGQIEEAKDGLVKLQDELKEKESIVEKLDDSLANLFTRFNAAYKRMKLIYDHWFETNKKKYVELVKRTEKPIEKASESMITLAKHAKGITHGNTRITPEITEEIDKAREDLSSATQEIEDIEEEYDER